MQVFSWEFSKILKNNLFTEHLRTTASGHFHSLNNLTFLAIQWTKRNQAFYTCEHVLSWLSSMRSEICIWKTLRDKQPIEAAVRICSSKVFSREICQIFTFLHNNPGGCFLTQLLLHRKTHFSEIARGIRLTNWLTFI